MGEKEPQPTEWERGQQYGPVLNDPYPAPEIEPIRETEKSPDVGSSKRIKIQIRQYGQVVEAIIIGNWKNVKQRHANSTMNNWVSDYSEIEILDVTGNLWRYQGSGLAVCQIR